MRLIIAANARIPSEQAHAFQIVQMAESFSNALASEGVVPANASPDITLLYANRRNVGALDTEDIWGYYSVVRNFVAERLPVIDTFPLTNRLPGRLMRLGARISAALVLATFNLNLLRRLRREKDAVIFSRDPISLMLIARRWPDRARQLFFEAHTNPETETGRRIRRWLADRIGGWIVITSRMREQYLALGVPEDRIIVANGGFRAERFAIEGDRAHWRDQFGWSRDAFIVGYMGRFHTVGMDKGLGDLAEAVIALSRDEGARPVRLGLVGGPDSFVEAVYARLAEAGLPRETVMYAGQVPAADVPGYLRAFDVCTMPFPWTEHFAYYASPLKLFEYMASGGAVVATDLPSITDFLTDGENGLIVPPSDPIALADALRRLRDDPALAARLAKQASEDAQAHTWGARGGRLLDFIMQMSRANHENRRG